MELNTLNEVFSFLYLLNAVAKLMPIPVFEITTRTPLECLIMGLRVFVVMGPVH